MTGHRDLRPEDERALSHALRGLFQRFRDRYPSTEFILLTALASGADSLAARAALSLDIPFRVILPFHESEYRRDFDTEEGAEFDRLLALASDRTTLADSGDHGAENLQDPVTRARLYARAGARIASIAHVMLALWNGKASDHVGGTGGVVEERLAGTGASAPDSTLLDGPEKGTVYHIVTPRRSDPNVDGAAGDLIVRTAEGRIDEARDPLRAIFIRIDEFNGASRTRAARKAEPLSLTGVRDNAEAQATRYKQLSNVVLNFVFVMTTAAAILLALSHVLLPREAYGTAYCILLLLALAVYGAADRRRLKERSIEYRALEVGLNIQRVWDLTGVRAAIADHYLLIMRNELDWIRSAIRTVHFLSAQQTIDPKLAVVAANDFVVSQRNFFFAAYQRDRRLFDRFKLCTKSSFGLSLTASVALFYVIFFTAGPVRDDRYEWAAVAIIVTTIFTAALHEYPRQRAFQTQARRYSGIYRLYAHAAEIMETRRDAPLEERVLVAQTVVREAGSEALAENGEWLLMHRELPIEPPDV